MKPGLYELVKSTHKPCIMRALEGRRLRVCRTPAGDGWAVMIKRTKKPIEGVSTVGDMTDDISLNMQTKRTVSMAFSLSDEGARGLLDALSAAIHLYEGKKGSNPK
jgi:hypothetical protein